MRGWWQELGGLVLPMDCAGCGLPRGPLCERCRAVLSRGGGEPCRVRPSPSPPGLPPVYAAAGYQDAVRAALLAHKERGGLGLTGPLGEALAGAVLGVLGAATGPGSRVWMVPVPSARWAVAARGHDPVRRLAVAAAGVLRRSGLRARVLPVLRQRRAVLDQAGLNARQRRANLAGALGAVPGAGRAIRPGPKAGPGRVVLVDDLLTTGASIAEAARVVRRIVGPVAGAAVIAAPPVAFELNRNSNRT
ncbi:ComF family protein [Streptomyces palmae]|uniref:ComF family protein n=1 Tax=Streptomyces palmae TaxID=1701085 RepID=A0A4Z0HA79_9ACTN|nr:ComF family protein [Streptomyces palmae]TGB14876.1 ComF family protein [Streptomyces palmae]